MAAEFIQSLGSTEDSCGGNDPLVGLDQVAAAAAILPLRYQPQATTVGCRSGISLPPVPFYICWMDLPHGHVPSMMPSIPSLKDASDPGPLSSCTGDSQPVGAMIAARSNTIIPACAPIQDPSGAAPVSAIPKWESTRVGPVFLHTHP
eukprot:gene3718-4130_t